MKKTVTVEYYAVLRLERVEPSDVITTEAATALELYDELRAKFDFSLDRDGFKVVVNDKLFESDAPIADGDTVIYIPPMVGG